MACLRYELIGTSKLTRSYLDPEPFRSSSSEGSISRWRRDEISALPQELLSQYLLVMQARERELPEVGNLSLATISEVTRDKATASQDSTDRDTLVTDPNASCIAEQERVRQMELLTVMWSRGYVSRVTALEIVQSFWADGIFLFSREVKPLVRGFRASSPCRFDHLSIIRPTLDLNVCGAVCHSAPNIPAEWDVSTVASVTNSCTLPFPPSFVSLTSCFPRRSLEFRPSAARACFYISNPCIPSSYAVCAPRDRSGGICLHHFRSMCNFS